MKEDRILKLLLLATKCYQDNFDDLRSKLSEKNRDYLNLVTVQGSKNRDDVELLSKIDLYDINTFDDLVVKVRELEE